MPSEAPARARRLSLLAQAALFASAFLPGCARTTPSRSPAPRAVPAIAWTYEVHVVGDAAPELDIVADFVAGSSDSLEVDEDAAAFVRSVEFQTEGQWRPILRRRHDWTAPCRAVGCRIRYTFALAEAAAQIADVDTAIAIGGTVIAPPSTWLLRPSETGGVGRFRFHVRTEGAVRFASGTLRAPDGARDTFEAKTSEIDAASFSAFGPIHVEDIRQGDAEIEVAIAPRGLPLDPALTSSWIESAATGIAHYYQRFPTPHTLVIVAPGDRGNVEGLTLGDGGPAIVLRLGPGLTPAAVRDDWVATHELLHVTLPSLSRDHAWLSEGIATYVEPIVRARAGIVTPERFWSDLVKGLPLGLPGPGDEGLERTHTWGRTYWGGALFCLVADLRIRETTNNARSFDDALRGIVATGADVQSHWDIERFLRVGDTATGTSVLLDLHRELGLAPGTVDLPALWSKLGVRLRDNAVTFDESALEANLRKAITDPKANY